MSEKLNTEESRFNLEHPSNPEQLRQLSPEELAKLVGRLSLELAKVKVELAAKNAEIEGLQAKINQDPLTGLLNKQGFIMAVDERLIAHKEEAIKNKQCVMFMLDGKKFKSVNDTLGHQEGDRALKGIADYLQNISLRKEQLDHSLERRKNAQEGTQDQALLGRGGVIYGADPVARMGGDEYAIFVEVDEQRTDVNAFVSAYKERIQDAHQHYLSQPENSRIKEIGLGMSVGHAIWDGEASTEQLLDQADKSMYAHKNDAER